MLFRRLQHQRPTGGWPFRAPAPFHCPCKGPSGIWKGFCRGFCIVALSLAHLHDQYSIVFFSSLKMGYNGSVEGSRRWPKRMTGSKASEGYLIRSIADGFEICTPPAIHYCFSHICWWWVCDCFTDERSRACVGYKPRGVAGGCTCCFGFSVCERITVCSFVVWFTHEGCRTRSTIEEGPQVSSL